MIALAKEMKVVKQDGEDKVKLQGPMAMIITEKEVQVFLFPFQYDGSVLVTALALAPIKLFCDTTVLDLSSLFLLAFITKNHPLSDIVLVDRDQFDKEQMRCYDIVTDIEAKIQEQRKEIEELKKKIEESKKKTEESKKKIEESKKKIEESKKKIEESKKKIEELKKEVERLHQLVDRERS